MNKKAFIVLLGLSILLFGGCLWYATRFHNAEKGGQDEKNAVKSVVEGFGEKMKNVSLLSPEAAEEIEVNYKNFIAPELLDKWKTDPSKALGRLTSSPWPDRIEIVNLEKTNDGAYLAQGNIIEITSVEEVNGGKASSQHISITLGKIANHWLITNIQGSSLENSSTAAYLGNAQLEKAITNYLVSQKNFSWKTNDESHNFCSVENLDPENELFPLYLWAYCGEYIIQNGELKTLSGSSGPVKIDYPNELSFYDSNKFSYEAPKDGALYAKDVKKIFPPNLEQRILNFDAKNIIKRNEQSARFNISSWEALKQAINNCEVKEVWQTHDRTVGAELSNQEKISTGEPKIDEIITLVKTAESKCGAIQIGTE